MPFDQQKFSNTKFSPRTDTVQVPALADFFPEGEKPEITIRGLTGEEFARVREAQEKNRNIVAVLEALAGAGAEEKIQAIRETLGLDSDHVPDDLSRRIEQLALGSVDPVLDVQAAAKIFRVWPVVGYDLTNRITVLSGQGMLPGE
jgi:hypothetical protein